MKLGPGFDFIYLFLYVCMYNVRIYLKKSCMCKYKTPALKWRLLCEDVHKLLTVE